MATTTDTQDKDERPNGEALTGVVRTGEVGLIPLLLPQRPKDYPPGPQVVQLEQQSSSKATFPSTSKDEKPAGEVPTWRGSLPALVPATATDTQV